MSRYDYADPGTDPDYCDRISEEPELCPTCKGNGTVFEHVAGGFLEKTTCGECGGRGYYEEA